MPRLRTFIPPASIVLSLAFIFAGTALVRRRLLELARAPSAEAEACLDRVIHEMYEERKAKPPQAPLDADGNIVTRFEPDGRVRWRRDMGGYVRSWECVIHAGKVILPRGMGLVALDDRTGDVAWTSGGPVFNLFGADNLVIVTNNAGNPEWKREIVARSLRDGSVVWCVPEVETHEAASIIRSGDLLFVRYDIGIENGTTTCVDLSGRVRSHLKEYVFSARETGSDVLVVTSRRVARLTRDAAVIWEARQNERTANSSFDSGKSLPMGVTDVLVCFYSPISSSGAEVWRLDAATGRVRWKAMCGPLMVKHSEYFHSVHLVPLKEEVVVVSRGGSGSFVEVLALSDGKRLTRVELPVTWAP